MAMNANDPTNTSEPFNFENEQAYQLYDLSKMDFRIILTGEQTRGKYSILEIDFLSEGDQEVPLHVHSRENLVIYVMEGDFLFRYGGDVISSSKDKILILDKDIPHSYRKIGKGKGSLSIMFIPAGFEHFFKDLGLTHHYDSDRERNEEQILLHLLEKKYGGKFVFG